MKWKGSRTNLPRRPKQIWLSHRSKKFSNKKVFKSLALLHMLKYAGIFGSKRIHDKSWPRLHGVQANLPFHANSSKRNLKFTTSRVLVSKTMRKMRNSFEPRVVFIGWSLQCERGIFIRCYSIIHYTSHRQQLNNKNIQNIVVNMKCQWMCEGKRKEILKRLSLLLSFITNVPPFLKCRSLVAPEFIDKWDRDHILFV